jgi:peptidoglycan hydrolase CwlO-like protein
MATVSVPQFQSPPPRVDHSTLLTQLAASTNHQLTTLWNRVGLNTTECEAKLRVFASQIEQAYLGKLEDAQKQVHQCRQQIEATRKEITEVCRQLVDAQDSLALVSWMFQV